MAKCVVELWAQINSMIGVQALMHAQEMVQEIVNDQPWNEDAKEAADALAVAQCLVTYLPKKVADG